MPNACPFSKWPSRLDAIDAAEMHGMVVNDAACLTCGQWHARYANSQEELEDTALSYRREIARTYPAVAQQRGWTSELNFVAAQRVGPWERGE